MLSGYRMHETVKVEPPNACMMSVGFSTVGWKRSDNHRTENGTYCDVGYLKKHAKNDQ